jgi:hypothetical protein
MQYIAALISIILEDATLCIKQKKRSQYWEKDKNSEN